MIAGAPSTLCPATALELQLLASIVIVIIFVIISVIIIILVIVLLGDPVPCVPQPPKNCSCSSSLRDFIIIVSTEFNSCFYLLNILGLQGILISFILGRGNGRPSPLCPTTAQELELLAIF